MAAVYAIDVALTEISRAFFVPLTLSVVQSFASSTAFAALLIGVLLTPFAPQDAGGGGLAALSALLKLPLWAIAIGIIATALAATSHSPASSPSSSSSPASSSWWVGLPILPYAR